MHCIRPVASVCPVPSETNLFGGIQCSMDVFVVYLSVTSKIPDLLGVCMYKGFVIRTRGFGPLTLKEEGGGGGGL